MKKIIFLIGILSVTALPAGSFGKDLDLKIKETKCTKEGIHLTYSIVNEKNFTRPNIGVGFKVEIDNKIVACKEARVNIPADQNHEHIMETIIPAPCEGKSYRLISTVFPSSISRYKIKNWFTECP